MAGSQIRVRTWVERDIGGWFCCVGFWITNPASVADPDEVLRAGPFESYEVANGELRGRFRERVQSACAKATESLGGMIIESLAEVDGGETPESA